jgi:hypothetical protein
MWAKFWVAVLVTLGLQALLVFSYLKLNPFVSRFVDLSVSGAKPSVQIVYSHPTLVLVSSFSLTYLTFVFVVTPSSEHLPEKQKHVMFLQTYAFTWLLLAGATYAVSSGIGGVYFATAWNAAVFLACAIGCVENMLGAHGSYEAPNRAHVHYAALPHPRRQDPDEEHPATAEEADDAEATETTPLIQSSAHTPHTKDESGAIGWWILQFILAVSIPVTLVAHITVMIVAATAQTLADGSSAVTGESP